MSNHAHDDENSVLKMLKMCLALATLAGAVAVTNLHALMDGNGLIQMDGTYQELLWLVSTVLPAAVCLAALGFNLHAHCWRLERHKLAEPWAQLLYGAGCCVAALAALYASSTTNSWVAYKLLALMGALLAGCLAAAPVFNRMVTARAASMPIVMVGLATASNLYELQPGTANGLASFFSLAAGAALIWAGIWTAHAFSFEEPPTRHSLDSLDVD